MAIEDILIEIIEDIAKGACNLDAEDSFSRMATPLYVLTNTSKNKGAAAMLYKNVLKDFASQFSVDEVIIIPSSVEEVLLIPKKSGINISERKCREMLLEVNETIEAEIVLSNNIYVYSLKYDEVRIYNDKRN